MDTEAESGNSSHGGAKNNIRRMVSLAMMATLVLSVTVIQGMPNAWALDKVAPWLKITKPYEGTVVYVDSSVKVVGYARDGLIGSGLNIVEVSVDDGPFSTPTPRSEGDYSRWETNVSFETPGFHKITARAIDNEGNINYKTVNVEAQELADTTAPSITAPADKIVEATGSLTSVSLGTPVVSDNVDPAPAVSNNAPPTGFPVGTTTVVWTAKDSSGNSASDSQLVTVTSTFDFSIAVSPTSGSINQGSSVETTVSGTLISGLSAPAALSVSGLPSGATASFSSSSPSGFPFSSKLTISTSGSTPAGSYAIKVNAVSGGLTKSTTYSLTVNALPVDVKVWEEAVGGGSTDQGSSVHQTKDGGYVILGHTESFGAGGMDAYVVKLDSAGKVQWSKTYGGPADEWNRHNAIRQTEDGGYIMAVITMSFGAGNEDILVLKLDSAGNVEWSRTFGGPGTELVYSIRQTTDGGYILGGWTTGSYDTMGRDFLIIKMDSAGKVQWSKTVGGSRLGAEEGYTIEVTSDGGYVLTGYSQSYGAGNGDVYILRLDKDGKHLWSKTYGGTGVDMPKSIFQTSDGGFIVGGRTNTETTSLTEYDFFGLKVDSSGNLQWMKKYGGKGNDWAWGATQGSDGRMIITGFTDSFGAGDNDAYLVKVDSSGNVVWSKTYGGQGDDRLFFTQQTADGGYVASGFTYSWGGWNAHYYVVKMNSAGDAVTQDTAPTTVKTMTPLGTTPTPRIVENPVMTSSSLASGLVVKSVTTSVVGM